MEIHLCCLRGFVPQPERDHGAIHTVVKKVHGRAVPTDMRGDLLPFKRRATPRGPTGVFGKEVLDCITAESAASDAGKDRIFGLAEAFA